MPEYASLADWVILQSGAVATGNGTAIEITDGVRGSHLALTVQITGITTATVTWEASVDGTNYVAVEFTNLSDGTEATTATANGIYRATALGLKYVRARISAWTEGAVYVHGYLTA